MAGNIRQNTREWSRYLWDRVKTLFSGLDTRVTALEQGGGGGGGAVSGVKGDAESTYRTGNVNLSPANLGAKAVQSAVSDPTASGTALTFIDTISQNAQGVITPTKKTVAGATQSADGLMSSTDKAKLDGIASGAQVNSITGVKGNAESTYRTGNVNLTPDNLGAVSKSQPNVTRGLILYTGDDYDTAPSADDYNYIGLANDNNDFARGGVYSIRGTTGLYRTVLVARKPSSPSSIWAEFGPRIASDGTISYSVTRPDKLRYAINVDLSSSTMTNQQIYDALNAALPAAYGIPATVYISGATASTLTGGKVTGARFGTVTRYTSDSYRFSVTRLDGSEMNAWSTTVSKSGDTYTITPGNVYQYSGTQI